MTHPKSQPTGRPTRRPGPARRRLRRLQGRADTPAFSPCCLPCAASADSTSAAARSEHRDLSAGCRHAGRRRGADLHPAREDEERASPWGFATTLRMPWSFLRGALLRLRTAFMCSWTCPTGKAVSEASACSGRAASCSSHPAPCFVRGTAGDAGEQGRQGHRDRGYFDGLDGAWTRGGSRRCGGGASAGVALPHAALPPTLSQWWR